LKELESDDDDGEEEEEDEEEEEEEEDGGDSDDHHGNQDSFDNDAGQGKIESQGQPVNGQSPKALLPS
jgi:hypothetical protein